MPFKDAVGAFFVEFTKFDSESVGMALRALSRDALFVDHAERLLDFEARLKLLERMAFARQIPTTLLAELEACLLRARQLHAQRDEVARNLSPDRGRPRPSSPAGIKPRMTTRRNADLSRLAELENMFVPAVSRIEEYTEEAVQLQEIMAGITGQLERHIAGGLAATGTG
jgi:hypothetical protein